LPPSVAVLSGLLSWKPDQAVGVVPPTKVTAVGLLVTVQLVQLVVCTPSPPALSRNVTPVLVQPWFPPPTAMFELGPKVLWYIKAPELKPDRSTLYVALLGSWYMTLSLTSLTSLQSPSIIESELL